MWERYLHGIRNRFARKESRSSSPQKSVEIGVGDRKCIIGGEEILNRHQLTYYNETAIFMEIADDDPDLEEVVKYLTDLVLERMGDVLQVNGIALRCVSGDAEQYKLAAKKLTPSNTNSLRRSLQRHLIFPLC